MDDPKRDPGEITRLLGEVGTGSAGAMEQLLPIVYEHLRRMADRHLAKESPNHTLQPTALVNEAYLQLIAPQGASFENRSHFFGAAAEAMRRILVQRARHHARIKRGGDRKRVTFSDVLVECEDPSIELLDLDDALSALEETDTRLARIVKLRYFAGMTIDQTAELVGASSATVRRHWRYARAWLFEKMG